MGNAYSAIAEDEYSLFYNPALLGRHKGLTVWPLNVNVGLTNGLIEIDRFDDFPSDDAVAISDRILGFPVYANTGATSGLKMATFSLSLFANTSSSIILENAINPILDIDYRYDSGIAAGFAFNFGSKGNRFNKQRAKDRGRNFGNGLVNSLGVGLKFIQREGLRDQFPVFSTTLLGRISSGEFEDPFALRESLGFTKGKGVGVDIGFDQTLSRQFTELSWGVSVLNIGGIDFNRTQGSGIIPDEEMQIAMGAALKQSFGPFGYTLSLDLKPLNYEIDFARKIHLGFELDMPLVDFFAGLNEGYLSYGVGVDIWALKLYAGFYSVELGREFKSKEGERAAIWLSLFDFSFGN